MIKSILLLTLLVALPALSMQQDTALAARATALYTSNDAQHFRELTALEKTIEIDVSADSVVTTVTRIWVYPTTADVQDAGYESIAFTPPGESLDVLTAGSVSGSGEIHWADRDNIKIIDSDTDNSFSDTRKMIVTYPALATGSMSIIRYRLTSSLTDSSAIWSRNSYIPSSSPVIHYSLEANWTDARPLYVKTNSTPLQCEHGLGSLRCSAANLQAVKSGEGVYWRDINPVLALSTAASWDAVKSKVAAGFDAALENQALLNDKVSKLTAGKDMLADKIHAIHSFVARDIRYVSRSEGAHNIIPHAVDDTISDRYGDCKDKSAVLIGMLQAIGIDAVPVLVATQRTQVDNVLLPALNIFDHAVVCFTLDGERHCLDATDENTPWDNTAAGIQNKLALPLSAEGELGVIDADPFRWSLVVDTHITYSEEGGQTEVQDVHFQNAYEGQIRRILSSRNADEQQTWASDLYADIVAEGSEPSFTFTGVENLGQALTSTSRTTFTPYYDPSEGIVLEEADAWLAYELSTSYFDAGQHPRFYPGSSVSSRYSLTLPEHWRLTRPPLPVTFMHQYGSLTRQVDITQQRGEAVTVTVDSQLRIPAGLLSPDEFDAFNAMLDAFTEHSMLYFAAETDKAVSRTAGKAE